MPTDLTELMAEDAPVIDAEETFITVDTPTTETKPADDAYVCVVCGTDVSHLYKRRVKEPRCEDHKKNASASKLGTGTRRGGGKDVSAAVETLDSWYSMLSMGLFMAGAQKSASLLAESADGLREKNETHLAQTPALAKRIAELGKTSATAAFFSAQALVLGPVAVLAASELMEKWGKPKQKNPEDFDAELPGTVGGFPVG